MIRIENLTCQSLAIGTLSIERGSTAVIGQNGSGKTTLLKLCAGILVPDAGSIRIDEKTPRTTDVGWVNEFPDRNVLFDTVQDEIASPLRFQHRLPDDIAGRVAGMLDTLGISHLAHRPVRELSGGEKVIVALAAALVTEPVALILDECDSHLDARTVKTIDRILSRTPIPYIIRSTQDMESAVKNDHVLFLETGRVGHYGTPETVFSRLIDTPFYPFTWKVRA
jgi:energy-coupling factor transport system ATP-binding protein